MNILWVSDFDLKGSGYFNISSQICVEAVNRGHEVKAIGLGYRGQEHNFPFGIIPAQLPEAYGIVQNIINMWEVDVLIIALDIPLQEQFIIALKDRAQVSVPYVGIFPLEALPLTFSWAVTLMKMDKRFVISKFGADELNNNGVSAVHLPVGIDSEAWRPPTSEEREKVRRNFLGLDDETFVVLTVADNQERKNLVAAMDAFRRLAQNVPNSVYYIVTREHNPIGWKLIDYASEIGISDKFMLFERGMPFEQLWSLYAAADAFVLSSKAEGLGIPLQEALAVGLPCIATDCTGMREQLSDGRGILVPHEYLHRDPFGNGERHWVNKELLAQALEDVALGKQETGDMVNTARAWIKTLTWDHCTNVLFEGIDEYGKKSQD